MNDEKLTYREVLSVARQTKSLEWDERTKAVDRIASSGLSDELGNMLTRLKDNRDTSAYRPALQSLIARLNRSGKITEAIAKQGIYEFIADSCVTCSGRGLIILENGVKIECSNCLGSPVRRWSDYDRAKSLGVNVDVYRRRYHRMMMDVADEIQIALRTYCREARQKLG